MQLQQGLGSESEQTRGVVVGAIKYMVVDRPHALDELLKVVFLCCVTFCNEHLSFAPSSCSRWCVCICVLSARVLKNIMCVYILVFTARADNAHTTTTAFVSRGTNTVGWGLCAAVFGV